MNLLKHSGLELPVYTEGEVAWTGYEIEMAALSGKSHFVRRAALRYDDYGEGDTLQSVLHLGDFVLANVCEVLAVSKVEHKWGLAKMSETNRQRLGPVYDSSAHELLPTDYGLVQRVSIVPNAAPLSGDEADMLNGLIDLKYLDVKRNPALTYAHDLRAQQFVIDPAAQVDSVKPITNGIVLVDTEPRMLDVDYDEE